MKYLLWLLKAAIFFTLFAFALNNQHLTVVHWFFGAQWQAPLVLVVLCALCLGLISGVLVMLPRWWQQRHTIQKLQAEAAAGSGFASATTGDTAATTAPAPLPITTIPHEL